MVPPHPGHFTSELVTLTAPINILFSDILSTLPLIYFTIRVADLFRMPVFGDITNSWSICYNSIYDIRGKRNNYEKRTRNSALRTGMLSVFRNAGIVYHREGIMGDYDDFDDLEELIRFIRTGHRD